MARPNVLTYKGSGILQIISDSEFNAIAEVVLEKFASVDGPGNIYNAQAANSAYVTIGDFTDTRYQGAVGTGDVTLLSTTYTLYQDRTSNYGSVTNSPLNWDGSNIKISNNTELNDLADAIVQYMVTQDGPGAYVLTPTVPAGGTWTSIGSINNVQDTANTSVFTLYKKIAGETTLTHSPLKHVSGGTIQIMTQAEIEELVAKVRERIITTQIGYYAFQLAAPTPGTWAEMGTIIDTRPTISAQDYVGPIYTGDVNYTGIIPVSYLGGSDVPYDTDYIGTYDTDYVSSVIVGYDGVAPAAYTTTFEGPSGINYQGPGFVTYVGDYLGGITYIGITPTNYVGDYIGPISYVGFIPATYVTDYVGPATYVGFTPATYVAGFIGTESYLGPLDITYDSLFTAAINYLGPLADSVNYASTTPASYLGLGAPVTYIGPLDGVLYVSTNTDGAPYASQSGVPNVNYLGPGPANFTNYTLFPLYLGPGSEPIYLGDITTVNYLGPGGPVTTYTSVVANVTNYLGPGVANAINYVGTPPNTTNYLGPASVTYVRTKTLSYVGPGAVNTTNYLGPGAATSYLGPGADVNYLGPGNVGYAGASKLDFTDYASVPSQNYFGPSTPNAVNYESDAAINYLGSGAPTNYLGAGPDVSYLGPLDGPTYIGPGTTPDAGGYIGQPGVNYTAIIAIDYLGTNPDGAAYTVFISYVGDYVGTVPDITNYIRAATYDGDYTGITPANYVGIDTYITDYFGLAPQNFNSTVSYLGDYVGIGPASYVGETAYLGQFAGATPIFYVGTLAYITDYIGVAGGVFSSPLPSSYTSSFDGLAYTTTYTTAVPDTVNYDSTIPNDYAGAVDYQSTYAGSIINNNSTIISTKTLWRRIL